MNPIDVPSTARPRAGWASTLARGCIALLGFELVSGLAITLGPFHPAIQWTVLAHTALGLAVLVPVAVYLLRHWGDYRGHAPSHVTVLGYVATLALAICCLSGVVLTWQGGLGVRITPFWRQAHLISTLVVLGTAAPHVLFSWILARRLRRADGAPGYFGWAAAGAALVALAAAGLNALESGPRYVNAFPADYSFLYGTNRPFAPSLARTSTGGALDARTLAGSASCGTAGCHEQIVEEWAPSAHRYAAMDTVFQGIQNVMAQQNGPESTRYCGGCHDPISLFAGAKNIFVKDLTGLHGYREGISCLACHAIRETDIKGNANYTVHPPREYLWQWETNGLAGRARDFLIRTYPDEHAKLSKRMFKKPEYCAACHKQFIDQEVNRVGWVQLQNQYDNWAASHWNKKGDPRKTVECRECHMPLVDSRDPAAGDTADYNRNAKDGKHRSHRFIASNQLMPVALKDRLPGWEEQVKLTEQWLQGRLEVPEIRDKWANGPIVKLALLTPETVAPGQVIPLRVVLSSSKVGHDFPTGPLDIIQSWLEIHVRDRAGREVWHSGVRDAKRFLEPGTFLFKAEPVDQHGNLIDRHNLWEMVGVRFRRALFPGYSDTVQFSIPCVGALPSATNAVPSDTLELPATAVPAPAEPGSYQIEVALNYRKVDQFLLNFLFGETNGLTSPVTDLARATVTVRVAPGATNAPASRTVAAAAVTSPGAR